ncbi:MAG: biotin--[acetyl-CoA-carboxylase] ligase [Bacteroidales bacterium]|nr:biotin--[acetyl-CoA-carboxylase] ligase [Bacteroidales bacterium]
MIIASNIIYREKVSSTNDLAAEMLAAGTTPDGTLIYAGEQTGGRGRKGNVWISEAGKNLTLSVILLPWFLRADQQFMVSKIVSLAICELLDPYSCLISIKWPNDIYHKDDKIAGILIEASLEGNKLQSCIAGAGININQSSFPEDLPNPVSLYNINKQEYDTEKLLSDFYRTLDLWYNRLKEGMFTVINKQYQKRLYRLNKPSDFMINHARVRGSIKGVDRYGRIKIRMSNGETGVYGFNEIKFIPQYYPSH